MPYEDATSAGNHVSGSTSAGNKPNAAKPGKPDAATWKPTGPDWKQNRPEGVFTIQELFEGTGCKRNEPLLYCPVQLTSPPLTYCLSHSLFCTPRTCFFCF